MDLSDSTDPYGRPARRTQWIVSTLAYHYGLDRGVENEIIVLATGLDQYLQEIFHHLDYEGASKITVEDYQILCEVLGLSEDSEVRVLDSLPSELTFRHFHAKLCGYFSNKAGCQYENGRLLVCKDSEHIETQIRLRSPLKRRGKLLSGEASASCSTERHASGCKPGSCARECYEEIVALEEAEDRISKLEDENANLRELIEDMRAALQSSDARCLALQVGLWKSHSSHKLEEGCFVAQQKQTFQNSSVRNNIATLKSIIHEMEMLRSAKERQVEEAQLCAHRLEQELWSCRETVAALEDCNRALKREQGAMRRKVEEARHALLSALSKVKELESQASHVQVLKGHIAQLQTELQFYRANLSYRTDLPKLPTRTELQQNETRLAQRCCLDLQHDRCSPTGRAVTTPDKMEEQLFRSVEGQAASDEEDDKWTGDQQRQVDEVKKILARLTCCRERCDDKAFRRLMSNFGSLRSEESCSAVTELLQRVTKLHKELEVKESQTQTHMDQESLVEELQQKSEETELLQMELQMLETERVRLSLVEDKLMDILQLLQQLRELNVSRRSLGKILLSTLGSCSDPQHGKAHILEVLNAFYHELAACEVLSTGGPLTRTQSQQSLNTLVITC
ncbi:EF-hand and coiled-coil domain-containing protein 1 isoform X2 [Eucyclogobius newberryi]|uniref:EF-hand and coiled-coil domain-containing protein 1 isoform X2 n=1 Tax=Eucyclogobius newberryi TaxID=166745 RepID=UPI003B5B1218